MTTLVNQKGPSKKKKGRSKKAHVLSAAVQKATENFIAKGEEIANENPEIRSEMLTAVDDVKKTGMFFFAVAVSNAKKTTNKQKTTRTKTQYLKTRINLDKQRTL